MRGSLKDFDKALRSKFKGDIHFREWHSSLILEGIVTDWSDVIAIGKMAAKLGYKGIVNRLQVKDLQKTKIKTPEISDNSIGNKQVDVLVIGGGVIGCSIARELSKWNISILLVEKECDLAMHTSSRNDGMVHPGFEPKPGSKKAIFDKNHTKL